MSSQSSILNSEYHWYALRITYSRELVLKEFLDKNNIENFIPMRYEYVTRKEQRIRKLVPAIHNLVFIYSTRKKIAGSYDQQIIYLPPTEYSMQKGDRVRITGGVFEGVEGIFVRVKGDRRVVVSIQGVMAVATTFIHPSLIVPITEE